MTSERKRLAAATPLTKGEVMNKVLAWINEHERDGRQFTIDLQISGDGRGGYEAKMRPPWRKD